MAGLNKVQLIGGLGQAPEVRHTKAGKAVANFSLATTTKTGGNDYTEWHKIVIWGKLAEVVGKYLKKGSQIYLEGRLQTRKWDDKDGNKRETVEIVCHQMIMLGGGSGSSASPTDTSSGGGDEPEDDSDIPF